MSTFQVFRAVIELLYFAAGVVIAIAAVWGLQQLRLTRSIATTNARREGIKFAAERCQYFAEYAVPAGHTMVEGYKQAGLTFLSVPWNWSLQNGEIVNHNFDTKLLNAEAQKIIYPLVNYLNIFEAFAIPFVARVADDDLGYQETAMSFCQTVKSLMPAFFHQRLTGVRFESTIRLYDTWSKRLVASRVAPAMKPMEELLKSVEKERIKTLGTEH